MNDHNSELQGLVLEIAKQNIALGQRIDGLAQQNIQLGQRIDVVSQTMIQQNTQVTQALLEQSKRIDETKEQMRQSQLEIVQMFHQIYSALEKLPEAVKDHIGFRPKL